MAIEAATLPLIAASQQRACESTLQFQVALADNRNYCCGALTI